MPIKRHKSLQTISHEHHYGLLFSWKIRKGFQTKIPVERIAAYADWFWVNYLIPHFKFEEDYIFCILDSNDDLVIRVLAEHSALEAAFLVKNKDEEALQNIEKKLAEHIRFEERIVFQEVESIATEEQLEEIERLHNKLPDEEWSDQFWM